MVNTDWADLNKDGKRLDATIKDMETKRKKCNDQNLEFAYIDRIIKATNSKVNIAVTVLNVKEILKHAKSLTK